MNILANCQKHYLKDVRDLIKQTLANPQGYVPNPKWTEFFAD